MIYVRIELWPGGNKEKARLLSEATIANVGGDATTGKYQAWFSRIGGFAWDTATNWPRTKVLRKVNVDGFPRKRLYAHDLLFRCLRAAFGERNGTPGYASIMTKDPINTRSEDNEVHMVPCGMYSCVKLKSHHAIMCDECYEDYKQDPDAYK